MHAIYIALLAGKKIVALHPQEYRFLRDHLVDLIARYRSSRAKLPNRPPMEPVEFESLQWKLSALD